MCWSKYFILDKSTNKERKQAGFLNLRDLIFWNWIHWTKVAAESMSPISNSNQPMSSLNSTGSTQNWASSSLSKSFYGSEVVFWQMHLKQGGAEGLGVFHLLCRSWSRLYFPGPLGGIRRALFVEYSPLPSQENVTFDIEIIEFAKIKNAIFFMRYRSYRMH